MKQLRNVSICLDPWYFATFYFAAMLYTGLIAFAKIFCGRAMPTHGSAPPPDLSGVRSSSHLCWFMLGSLICGKVLIWDLLIGFTPCNLPQNDGK